MAGLKVSWHITGVLGLVLATSAMLAHGQIVSPCTNAMISSFAPCFNYITGSSGNGSSPTADCCQSLRSLMSTSMDCTCLVVTGNVPFQIPFNRTLAISLPRACKMDGFPVQCKSSASGSPLASPGPATVGIVPPVVIQAPPPSTKASIPESSPPALPPESDTTVASPPPADSATPTSIPGMRPLLNPSAAMPSYIYSPSLFLFALGVMVLCHH